MKTAVEQIIEQLRELREECDDFDHKVTFTTAITTAEIMLQTEKEQITQAYHEGQRKLFQVITGHFPQADFSTTEALFKKVDDGLEPNDDAEAHYTQTFNQK